jgi:hypothetical protein
VLRHQDKIISLAVEMERILHCVCTAKPSMISILSISYRTRKQP